MFRNIYLLVSCFVLFACSSIDTEFTSDDTLKIKENNLINQEQQSDIKLITDNFQKYISNLGNVSGDFVQKSSNGEKQIGKFYISIPGKMRIDYNNGVTVLADGHNFIYYDSSNDQITVLDLNSSPAGILLSNIKFDNIGARIISIDRKKNTTNLHTVVKNSTFNTKIIFKVIESPFKLVGWIVNDLQGITTNFSMTNVKNVAEGFNKDLFILKRKKLLPANGIKSTYDY